MKRLIALSVLLINTIGLTHAQHVADSLGSDCIGLVSASSLMEGKVSGVRVLSSDGSLNGQHLVYIRGLNSIHSDSQPLFVVDGTVLNQGTLNPDAFYQTGGVNSAGDQLPDYSRRSYTSPLDGMSWLDLYDIESVEVLKDISETAKYGVRGANGVVIIKTKKGNRTDSVINLRTGFGVMDSYRSGDVFKTGFMHNHHASVCGTSDGGINYNASLFYRQSDGPVIGNSLSNGGLALNLETKANKIFWFGLNARIGVGSGSYPSATSYIGSPTLMTAVRKPYEFTDDTVKGWLSDYDDDSKDYRTVGSAYVIVNFLPSLSMTLTGGIDYFNNKRYIWYGNGTSFGMDFNGAASILNNAALDLNGRLSLDYNRYFSSVHHLQVSVSGEVLMSEIKNNCMNGTDFISHHLRAKGLSASNSRNSIRKIHQTSQYYSAQGIVKYDFAEYAGLSALLNMEWNRRFDTSPNLFPAANAYVNLKDIFIHDAGTISELKVSAGWGSACADKVLPYIYANERKQLNLDIPSGAEDYYYCLDRLKSKEWNAGVSAGFLNRVNFSIKYYEKSSEESFGVYDFSRLVEGLYDETSSGTLKYANPVQISNKGVELDVQANLIDRSSLKWSAYANVAYNKSEMTGITDTGALSYLDRTVPKFLGGLGTTLEVADFTIQARLSSAAGYYLLDANSHIGKEFTGFSDADLKKADYLKLDNLSVGYRIPLNLKWIDTAMVHLTGKNLFYVSGYDGCNPNVNCYAYDASMYGVDYGAYPVTRSVIIGLNLIF